MLPRTETKPIPHIFHQAAVLAGSNNNTNDPIARAKSMDELLLPSIDICTIEIPENTSLAASQTSFEACKITKLSPETTNIIKTVNWEQLALHHGPKRTATGHHIRHQRNHNAEGSRGQQQGNDPRNKILNKIVVFTKQELDNFNNVTTTATTTHHRQNATINRR